MLRATSELIAHLSIFLCRYVNPQINRDFAELFQGGFEVFDDFLAF